MLDCYRGHIIDLFLFLYQQLDNLDEQAAQIRRELDGRLQMADQIARVSQTDTSGFRGFNVC